KTMSIPDDAIADYRRLLLDTPGTPGTPGARRAGGDRDAGYEGAPPSDGAAAGEAEATEGGIVLDGSGGASPAGVAARDAKRALARELVAWLHSPEAAAAAEQQFERVHVKRAAPDDVEEACFDADGDGPLHLPSVIS